MAEYGQAHFKDYRPDLSFYLDTFFPDMDGGRWYHRWNPLTGTAGGFDINRDVLNNHGPLGALYTIQKEGDTPVFMWLIPNGLNPLPHPSWGSWSGRFGRENKTPPVFYWANVRDTWNGSTNRDNTLKRWAVHLQDDFRARMDWCVKSFGAANHEPEPVVNSQAGNGVIELNAFPGNDVQLSAAGSTDPDGNTLSYQWIFYNEPGTYKGNVSIFNAKAENARVKIPGDFSENDTLHIVLIATDNGSPSLTRYRRVLIRYGKPVDKKHFPKSRQKTGLFIHPNPFKTNLEIKWVGATSNANYRRFGTAPIFEILDLRGTVIKKFSQGRDNQKNAQFFWGGKDQQGKYMSSGIYLVKARFGREEIIQRAILMR